MVPRVSRTCPVPRAPAGHGRGGAGGSAPCFPPPTPSCCSSPRSCRPGCPGTRPHPLAGSIPEASAHPESVPRAADRVRGPCCSQPCVLHLPAAHTGPYKDPRTDRGHRPASRSRLHGGSAAVASAARAEAETQHGHCLPRGPAPGDGASPGRDLGVWPWGGQWGQAPVPGPLEPAAMLCGCPPAPCCPRPCPAYTVS